MGPAISDNNVRLILLSVIQLSGGRCNFNLLQLIFFGKCLGNFRSCNLMSAFTLFKSITIAENILCFI